MIGARISRWGNSNSKPLKKQLVAGRMANEIFLVSQAWPKMSSFCCRKFEIFIDKLWKFRGLLKIFILYWRICPPWEQIKYTVGATGRRWGSHTLEVFKVSDEIRQFSPKGNQPSRGHSPCLHLGPHLPSAELQNKGVYTRTQFGFAFWLLYSFSFSFVFGSLQIQYNSWLLILFFENNFTELLHLDLLRMRHPDMKKA